MTCPGRLRSIDDRSAVAQRFAATESRRRGGCRDRGTAGAGSCDQACGSHRNQPYGFFTCPRISPATCADVCTLTYALPVLSSTRSESPETPLLTSFVRSTDPSARVPDEVLLIVNV